MFVVIEVKKTIYLLDKKKNIAILISTITFFLWWQNFKIIYELIEKSKITISISW